MSVLCQYTFHTIELKTKRRSRRSKVARHDYGSARNAAKCVSPGRVTMTTDSNKNGTVTSSGVNLSGHVGQVTIFSLMLTTGCCLLVGLGLGLGLGLVRFSVWLVGGYAHVFMLFSVVTVTLPLHLGHQLTEGNRTHQFAVRQFAHCNS